MAAAWRGILVQHLAVSKEVHLTVDVLTKAVVHHSLEDGVVPSVPPVGVTGVSRWSAVGVAGQTPRGHSTLRDEVAEVLRDLRNCDWVGLRATRPVLPRYRSPGAVGHVALVVC